MMGSQTFALTPEVKSYVEAIHKRRLQNFGYFLTPPPFVYIVTVMSSVNSF